MRVEKLKLNRNHVTSQARLSLSLSKYEYKIKFRWISREKNLSEFAARVLLPASYLA